MMEAASKLKELNDKYEFVIECKENYFNIFATDLSGEEVACSWWNPDFEDAVNEIIEDINLIQTPNENVKRNNKCP